MVWDSPPNSRIVLIEDISDGVERFAVPVATSLAHLAFMDISVFEKFKYTTRIMGVAEHKSKMSATSNLACTCSGKCDEECPCSSRVYHQSGVVDDMDLLMSDSIRECNDLCECALWCGNRVAQKGARYPVEIFSRDPQCGWAVRATTSTIPPGTFIGEYTGDLIDDDTAATRDSTFLFETRIGSQTFTIDAKYRGNYTRFINHSCSPNIKVANVSWDCDENQLIHMCFYTSQKIEKGEELTIDYGESWWVNKNFSCLCNSPKCRYRIGERKKNNFELIKDVTNLRTC